MSYFLALGGANEIGANCYYLNFDEIGIILDCGMHPRKKGLEALPNFSLLDDKPVDYVLISHAHQDHLNALPFLVKKFPHIKIITTPQTRALAELTLHNTISILKSQVKSDEMEVYSHEEIDLLIKTIDYKSYNEKVELKGMTNPQNPVTVEFFDAGHILGSASILLAYKNKNIYYTGDVNSSSQTILNGGSLPQTKVDVLITETTYGSTDLPKNFSWKSETERFIISLNSIINKGGSVLIPVFSLGKMQEILSTIWLQMEKNKLTRVDIYTGGISEKINRAYDYNRFVVNRNEKELVLHDIPQKNIYEISNTDELFKHPCIVLATSGMMIENTNSYLLAKRWLKEKGSAIFTVGYMDEDTPGYKIANSRTGDKLQLNENEKKFEVKCEIKNFRFSAHSKCDELIRIVKSLNPDKVLLIHGDSPAIDRVGSEILKRFPSVKLYSPKMGNQITFDY